MNKHNKMLKLAKELTTLIVLVATFAILLSVITTYLINYQLSTTQLVVICTIYAFVVCWVTGQLNKEQYFFKKENKQLDMLDHALDDIMQDIEHEKNNSQ